MFCMKCGKPTEGEQIICPECAAKQAAPQPAPQPVYEQPAPQPVYEQPAPQPVYEQPAPQPVQPVSEQPAPQPVYQQPVQPQQPLWQEAPQQPSYQPAPQPDTFVLNTPEAAGKKPRKKKNKLLSAIIALVAVAALVVGGIFGWPYIKNAFNKATTSPEKYNSQSVAGTISDRNGVLLRSYSKLRNNLLAGNTAETSGFSGSIRLQMDESVLTGIIGPMTYGTPFEDMDFSFLKDISLAMDGTVDKGLFFFSMTPVLGDTQIVTMEVGLDIDGETVWIRLPELSDEYILGELDMDGMSYADMQEAMGVISQLAGILPEEEVLSRLLSNYITLAMNEITDVSEEEITLKSGGIEQKVTAIVSTIDHETAIDMAIAVLKEAQDDKDIANICKDIDRFYEDLYGYSADMEEMFQEALPEALEELEAIKDDGEFEDGEIILTTYVDATGKLIGLALEVDETEITAYTLHSGDEVAYCFEMPQLEIKGSGTEKNGILNATFKAEAGGIDIGELEISGFDTENLTKGTIAFTPDREFLEEIAPSGNAAITAIAMLSLELSFDENTVSLAVTASGKDMLRLSVEAQQKPPATIYVPSHGVDPEDEAAMESWGRSLNFKALLNNLRQAGLPGELVDYMEQSLDAAMNPDVDPENPDDSYSEEFDEFENAFGTGTVIAS